MSVLNTELILKRVMIKSNDNDIPSWLSIVPNVTPSF